MSTGTSRNEPARAPLGPVEGFRLEDGLCHAWVVSPIYAAPPAAAELGRLRACLAWWQQFVTDVASDYQAQQLRLQRPPYLLTADGAYASRVAEWITYTIRETDWRVDDGNRAAVKRVTDGTATAADRERAAMRPAAPASTRPRWADAPPNWPIAVSGDERIGAFHGARWAAYRAANPTTRTAGARSTRGPP